MEPSVNATFLVKAGIIVLAFFYLSLTASLIPLLLRLFRFIADKYYEYQQLDYGDTLTLLRDAGLSPEQALWFYEKFYSQATGFERFLIKLYITRSINSRKMQ